MLRSYIQINLHDGRRFKYVRDYILNQAGDSATDADRYTYGDTAGDTYAYQGDTGQIKGDHDQLMASYIGDTSGLLLFPELIGDTGYIVRKNYDQPVGITGDSGATGTIVPKIMTSLPNASIVNISVIEEVLPDYLVGTGNIVIPNSQERS